MNFSIPIFSVLIGVVVLFFGRKLFWLCVAAIGFAAGVELAPHLVHEPSALLSLTIALLLYRRALNSKRDYSSPVRIDNCVYRPCGYRHPRASSISAREPRDHLVD